MANQKSRGQRFAQIQSDISGSKAEMEELRDELQSWLDNMPENLQQSSKAEELEEAISNLEDIINQLDEVENADVSFPSMF